MKFDYKLFKHPVYRFILWDYRHKSPSSVVLQDADLVIKKYGEIWKDRTGDSPRHATFYEYLCAYVVCAGCGGRSYGRVMKGEKPCSRCLGRGYTTIWKNLLTIATGKDGRNG